MPDDEVMPPEVPTADLLRAAVEVGLPADGGPLVLAVSGGRDSMALLHAVARWAPHRIAAVATFDHGTGAFATEAAGLVVAEARRLGLTAVRERARGLPNTEVAWRDARWAFLRRVARAYQGRIVTAHTQDDQLETIVMRILRGAGARGIAALAAPSPMLRPWLPVRRHEVAGWVEAEAIPYCVDPTNASPQFLRGRVRSDHLPALERVRPGFGDSLLALGEAAAHWRRELEAFVDGIGAELVPGTAALRVPTAPLVGMTPAGLAVVWPALCARVGVILDAKGTRALVGFTTNSRRGAYLTVAGGGVVLHHGVGADAWFELRRALPAEHAVAWSWSGDAAAVPRRLGAWRFSRVVAGSRDPDHWSFAVPTNGRVSLRGWRAGDRMQSPGFPTGRRISRYFADRHIPAVDRTGWPVVFVNETLVAVPGVCPPTVAPTGTDGADIFWYRCERESF